MHLTRNPLYLSRLAHPDATEDQINAYGLEEERIMTAFTADDDNDE